MFDWEKAFKISSVVLVTAFALLVLAIFAHWDFIEAIVERSINSSSSYRFVGDIIMAFMSALRYSGWVDFWVTFISAISTLITYLGKENNFNW